MLKCPIAIALLLQIGLATAASFTVTNTSDSGPGSLRDAVAQANANPGPDVVTIGVTGTILLTSGQINIMDATTIIGPGAGSLTIDANANSRVFTMLGSNAACPAAAGPDYLVTLSGMRLANARRTTSNAGGAIVSFKSLVLDAMVLEGNVASLGAGVAFFPEHPGQSLTISNSRFTDNRALPLTSTNTAQGGALYVADRCAPTRTSPVALTIANSVFEGNSARPTTGNGFGGAMALLAYLDVTITDTRIVDNFVQIPNPLVPGRGYYGGGLAGNPKSIRIERSEIAGNTSDWAAGMGLFNDTPDLQAPGSAMAAKIVNSTISGNSASFRAGGIQVYGNVALELVNSTVHRNMAPPTFARGIRLDTGETNPATGANAAIPTLTLVSSVVANDTGTEPDIGISGTLAAILSPVPVIAVNSLVKTPSPDIALNGAGNVVGVNPGLGPLGHNGGFTRTHVVLPGSPVIRAGSNPLGLATDQRGAGHPRTSNGGVDIGAYQTPPGGSVAYFVTPGGQLLGVDTATHAVASPIAVGANPYAAVVNPAGTRVYVTNFNDNSVSVVDAATQAVIATIPVGAGPQGIAVSPGGSRVYVACWISKVISVIDAGTSTVVKSIPGLTVVDVAVNANGTRLYAAGAGVTVIDAESETVTGTLAPTALSAFGTLALAPGDARLYAWSDGSYKIAAFDLPGGTFAGSIPIATTAFANDGIVVHPSGAPVYHSTGTALTLVDPVSLAVVTSTPLGGTSSAANGVAVTPDGGRVYAATGSGVRVYDTVTNTVTPVATGPVRALGKFIGPAAPAAAQVHTGLTATGSGIAAADVACTGAAACLFTRAAWLPPPGMPGAPPLDLTVAGVDFPQGTFDFVVAGGTPGFAATLTLTFPQPLPAGTTYYKFGPTAADPTPHWYVLPATISGRTVTFTITDGGLGDDDLSANGVIVDAGGPGMPVSPSHAYVQKAYVAYYGRPADPGGQDYWASRMDAAGGSLDAIIAAFGNSDEFNRRYGGLPPDVLVTKIYQQALARDPDPAGLDYYVSELLAGRRTLQTITLDVLNGATTAPDSTVVANKLLVAEYYTSRVALGCAYGTEQDGVDIIAGVTAEPATVGNAKAAIDTRCGP